MDSRSASFIVSLPMSLSGLSCCMLYFSFGAFYVNWLAVISGLSSFLKSWYSLKVLLLLLPAF